MVPITMSPSAKGESCFGPLSTSHELGNRDRAESASVSNANIRIRNKQWTPKRRGSSCRTSLLRKLYPRHALESQKTQKKTSSVSATREMICIPNGLSTKRILRRNIVSAPTIMPTHVTNISTPEALGGVFMASGAVLWRCLVSPIPCTKSYHSIPVPMHRRSRGQLLINPVPEKSVPVRSCPVTRVIGSQPKRPITGRGIRGSA